MKNFLGFDPYRSIHWLKVWILNSKTEQANQGINKIGNQILQGTGLLACWSLVCACVSSFTRWSRVRIPGRAKPHFYFQNQITCEKTNLPLDYPWTLGRIRPDPVQAQFCWARSFGPTGSAHFFSAQSDFSPILILSPKLIN